jgi:hypothetical protein
MILMKNCILDERGDNHRAGICPHLRRDVRAELEAVAVCWHPR